MNKNRARNRCPNFQIICCGKSGQDVLNSQIIQQLEVPYMSVSMEGELKHKNLKKQHKFILKRPERLLGNIPFDEADKLIQNSITHLEPLIDADVVFINCELGADPCTGYVSTLARVVRDSGAFTIAVAHTIYPFYGDKQETVWPFIIKLEKNADLFIFIPFDNLGKAIPHHTVKEGYEILLNIVAKVIQDIIFSFQGKGYRDLFNLQNTNLIEMIKASKKAHIGWGVGYGEKAYLESVNKALKCPLLELKLDEAALVLLTVSGDENLNFFMVKEIIQEVADAVGSETGIAWEVFTNNEDDRVDTLIIALK